AQGQQHQVEPIIDTGFNGELALPVALAAALGLVWTARETAYLADGSSAFFDIYAAVVLWDGTPRTVEVLTTNTAALLGTELLRHHILRVAFEASGIVSIDVIP